MSNLETLLSRDAFLLSVDIRLFWFVALIYGASLVLYIIHLVTKKTGPGKLATNILWFGVITHAGLILLRTFEGQRAPFQTLYESLSWFAWSASVTYLFVERKWKDIYMPGILVTSPSMGACLYPLLTRRPAVEPLSPPLQSYWFEWHVVLAFLSYAVFVVSCSIEIAYIAVKASVTKGYKLEYGLNMHNLETFHRQSFRLALFGFPLLTFGIFSGAACANEAWGRYWGWDPKETWSLITWTVFAIYLHSISIPKWKGLPASLFNILGFICMLMTFIGVNWLARLLGLPSLGLYAL